MVLTIALHWLAVTTAVELWATRSAYNHGFFDSANFIVFDLGSSPCPWLDNTTAHRLGRLRFVCALVGLALCPICRTDGGGALCNRCLVSSDCHYAFRGTVLLGNAPANELSVAAGTDGNTLLSGSPINRPDIDRLHAQIDGHCNLRRRLSNLGTNRVVHYR